jgi:hypothetical protein
MRRSSSTAARWPRAITSPSRPTSGRSTASVRPRETDGFRDLDASASDEDLDGVVVRVASLDDLIRMKRAADRPQDRIAVEWLSALHDELEG